VNLDSYDRWRVATGRGWYDRTEWRHAWGVPSEFRDGNYIAADAAIECGWELGEPYRAPLFGR
jgi:hypothetical protein